MTPVICPRCGQRQHAARYCRRCGLATPHRRDPSLYWYAGAAVATVALLARSTARRLARACGGPGR